MDRQKKKFRLADGTEVTADKKIYTAYKKCRNREQYLNRKERSHSAFSLDDERSLIVADSFDTQEEAEKIILQERVRAAIRMLSEKERLLIKQYFFDGFSIRELAKIYGISHTKIHQQLLVAMEHLKGILYKIK